MGKRVNVSQPVVIQTELTPLSDIFSIEASDTLEQWYYVNGGGYSPDRNDTPLVLTPVITAKDTEENVTYSPSLSPIGWYYFDKTNTTDYSSSDSLWPGLGWVKITDTDASHTNTYILGTRTVGGVAETDGTLIVKKNVPVPSENDGGGQMVCCVARYIDPRDVGVSYTVKDVITLATNLDANTDFITVDIQAPAMQTFNPLQRYNPTPVLGGGVVRNDTQYTFSVKVLKKADNSDVTSGYTITWYANNEDLNGDVLLNTLPCYKEATQQTNKGQGTDTVTIDAMYIEEVTLKARISKNGTMLPVYDTASLSWEFPSIDSSVVCNNGNTVNNVSRNMHFSVIANTKDGVLSEEQKKAHLYINWKKQKSTDNYEDSVNLGYGQEIDLDSDILKQTDTYVTIVNAEIYSKGAYEEVTQGGETVTYNSDTVYNRN